MRLRVALLVAGTALIACSSDGADPTDVDISEIGVDAATVTDVGLPDASGPEATDWVAYVRVESGGLERVVMARTDGSGEPFELPVDEDLSIAKHPAFSPDGEQIVYSYSTSELAALRLVRLSDLSAQDIATEFAAVQLPSWSPSRASIAFRAKVTPDAPWSHWVMSLDTLETTEIVPETPDPPIVSALSYDCNGSRFFHVRGIGGPGGQTDLWVMDVDGSNAEQLTFGRSPTSLLVRVDPNCREVVLDSLTHGGPLRIGVDDSPAAGALELGFGTPIGIPGVDSNCTHAPGGSFVCQRMSGPAPEFFACTGGGAGCVPDIVAIDGSTNQEISNATRSIDARETFPVAARLAADFQPL